MPTNHRLRLDNEDRVRQCRIQSIQPDQEQTIDVPQPQAPRVLAAQHYKLLAEEKIFGLKPHAAREPSGEQAAVGAETQPSALHYNTPTRTSLPDRVFGSHTQSFSMPITISVLASNII